VQFDHDGDWKATLQRSPRYSVAIIIIIIIIIIYLFITPEAWLTRGRTDRFSI